MMRKLYFARVSPHLHVPAEGPECGGARPLRVRDRRGGGRCRRVMVRTASSQSLDICDLMPGTEMARRSPWRRGAWRSWWRGRSGS